MGTEGREGLQVTARGRLGNITKRQYSSGVLKRAVGFGPAL